MKFIGHFIWLPWLLGAFTEAEAGKPIERQDAFNCLAQDPLKMDIIRRYSAPLLSYPELRSGCDTFSSKPFNPLSHPPEIGQESEDPAAIRSLEFEIPDLEPSHLDVTISRYFVVDMHGVEHELKPGSEVTVEIYDLSEFSAPLQNPFKLSSFVPVPLPPVIPTKFETINFEQVCFPVSCYRPGEKTEKGCVMSQMLAGLGPKEVPSEVSHCLQNPRAECKELIGLCANARQEFKREGNLGLLFATETSVYCAVDAEDGKGHLTGSLLTPEHHVMQALLHDSKPPRSQMNFDTFAALLDATKLPAFHQDGTTTYNTSVLIYSFNRKTLFNGLEFLTGCEVTVPLGPYLNNSFAINFQVQDREGLFFQLLPIKPGGPPVELRGAVKEVMDENSFRYKDVVYNATFQDLCFPAKCFEVPPKQPACPVCQPKPDEGGLQLLPDVAVIYQDHRRGITKLLSNNF